MVYNRKNSFDYVVANGAFYSADHSRAFGYARYLAQGWPIATGVIEEACRQLVKDQCETSGMHWCPGGTEQVLALRTARTNGN